MIELVLVIAMCRHLGGKVRAKGRTAWPFQLMLVVFWFGGEFAAGIVAGIVYAVLNGAAPDAEPGLWVYLVALAGAGAGAGLAYLIVAMLSPVVVPEFGEQVPAGFGPNSGAPLDPDNPYASPWS